MNRLIIIGAGGHGKSIADNALKNGYTDIAFVDDHVRGECMGFPIIGVISNIEKLNDGNTDFIIGLGDNSLRCQFSKRYSVRWVTLIHPTAVIATNAVVGEGTVVMAGAVINASSSVGRHCIINTSAIVEHDNKICDYVHMSPASKLGGTVTVGELTQIGIGATVSNNIEVCSSCIIGAGAVVVQNIKKSGTYVGVPAREIE